MPIYVYKCPGCHREGDFFFKIADLDKTQINCMDCSGIMQRQMQAPYVRGDYQAYSCPISGKMIEGRKAHKENLARHGCRILEPGETEQVARRRKQEDESLDKAIEETVEREIHTMPTAKREKLVAELQGGLDTAVVRTTPTI